MLLFSYLLMVNSQGRERTNFGINFRVAIGILIAVYDVVL